MDKFKYAIDFEHEEAKRIYDINLKWVTIAFFNWAMLGISQDFKVLHLGFVDIIRRF